ncbi:MAG: type II secretion system F family protein [Bacillota bacterium]|nr:type II secretion system F family protein [Bacillota bacterium]
MPIYEYEARNSMGSVIKGTMDASDKEGVIASLRGKSYYPITIKAKNKFDALSLDGLQKVKLKDISIFCRQFSVMQSAGLSILRILEILKQQTENKKLQKQVAEVHEDVQKGKSVSDAMKRQKDFPDMLCNMIKVGESSGTLDRIMERMADFYDQEYKQQRKVKAALTYPMIIVIVAILVVALLVMKVIPIFVTMIPSNVQLPLPTRIVLGLSNFMQKFWWLVLLIALAIYLIPKLRNAPQEEKEDRWKLKAPLYGKIYTKIYTARFARTFGTLISSGVPLLDSIKICGEVIGSKTIKNTLDFLEEQVKKGATIGNTLETKSLFSPMLIQMIKVGEESGTLEQVLDNTAEFYDGEVQTATDQLTTMIEPIIIVILGIVVAFIIISVMLPMLEMYNSIK